MAKRCRLREILIENDKPLLRLLAQLEWPQCEGVTAFSRKGEVCWQRAMLYCEHSAGVCVCAVFSFQGFSFPFTVNSTVKKPLSSPWAGLLGAALTIYLNVALHCITLQRPNEKREGGRGEAYVCFFIIH